ncbi:glycosyltransferase family 1 protein [Puteibacter caeruleilacunae]|nr:glycosyltransferase family 1 protein [Puteibacter caeruleilacunae]
MRIVVNTRLLQKNKLEGIGRFSYETLSRIVQDHPEHEFFFVFDRPYDEKFIFGENVTPIVLSPPTRHPLLWYYWFEWRIPGLLKKLKADVFVSPDGYLSLRSKVKQVAVIHDINFVHRPKDLPWSSRVYYNYFFPRFAHKADELVTVSEFSAGDIYQSFKVDPGKIEVAHNGVNKSFVPLTEDQVIEVRKKYSTGKPYFVFVGALHPRKNIEGLLRAFDLFKDKSGSDMKLIIVGGKMFGNRRMEQIYKQMRSKEDVIFTGRVPSVELRRIVGGALAMTFIPFFEGFGIPVIEAMASGVPVICSDTTSLPEAGGDAALFVNPEDAEQVSDEMSNIVRSEDLRKDLINKGLVHASKFTWRNTAERLWKCIEIVLKNM